MPRLSSPPLADQQQPQTPEAGDRLLIDIPRLATVTSLSVRHLRRLDSSRDIPGRVVAGRRVLFQTEVIRKWVALGLPDRQRWEALVRAGKF